MNALRAFVAAAALAAPLSVPAFAATPGESKLDRLTVREAVPREPSVGAMRRAIALARLRDLGYSPKTTLELKDRKWEMIDVKSGHRIRIDAVSGKVDDLLRP